MGITQRWSRSHDCILDCPLTRSERVINSIQDHVKSDHIDRHIENLYEGIANTFVQLSRADAYGVMHSSKPMQMGRNKRSVASGTGMQDKAARIARLGVSVGTLGYVHDQSRVADGSKELMREVFSKEKNSGRLDYGVPILPLGAPIDLGIIFEIAR